MTDTEPPIAETPRRRRRHDRPFAEPYWAAVWKERAKEVRKLITHPMTPKEVIEAISHGMRVKEFEAGQLLAAADKVTIRWTGVFWVKL